MTGKKLALAIVFGTLAMCILIFAVFQLYFWLN